MARSKTADPEKSTKGAKRKQCKGLFTRGKQKRYYLQYYVNGKRYIVSLKDETGRPITSAPEAEAAAAKFLYPVQVKDKAERLRHIQDEIATLEEKALKADRILQNEKAQIVKGWDLFMKCLHRPSSCKRYKTEEMPEHCTQRNYWAYFRKFSEWIAAEYPACRLLSEITPEIARGYMAQIEGEVSAGTYNKNLMFFRMFFDVMQEDEVISCNNPFAKIPRMDNETNSRNELNTEQIVQLIQTAQGEMKYLFIIGYETGFRLGDCCTLRWEEVDLMRGVIVRIPRKTAHTKKDQNEKTVKLGISEFLNKTFQMIRQGGGDSPYVLPALAEEYLNGKTGNISKRIQNVFIRCGIQTQKEGTGQKTIIDESTGEKKQIGKRAVIQYGFHSLRYSYISHNAEAGTPEAVIQRNAGHANPAMTRHYTRISDSGARKYAEAIALPLAILDDADAIDVEAVEVITPAQNLDAREQLKELAETLPLNIIEQIIEQYGKAGE